MPFDALIVLGCRVHQGRLTDTALRRVERTALAYREQGAELVIASGGKAWQGFPECEVFGRGLLERGVPVERLLHERESMTTRGNARGVAGLIRGRDVRKVGLVTSDWHMARALRLFQTLELELTPLPAPSAARPLHVRGGRWLRERGSLAIDLTLLRLRIRA
ncbi:MAG TPA: YdcF family protein [Polyangiaceae bacterium]